MLIPNITLMGWLHSISSIMALLTGAWNLAMPKGTATHRKVGRWYFYAALVAILSSLAVYEFDIARFRPFVAGAHIFGLFHWEAIGTLIALLLGIYAAPRQKRAVWAYVHPVAMVLTYYMLIGALINESFVRITFLRALLRSQMHGPDEFFGTRLLGQTQGGAMLFFIVLIVYFVIKVALYRRGLGKATPA